MANTMQNAHSLILSLYQIGAIQFGEFKLKSGETSSIYINLRKIISYPLLLKTVADAFWEKIKIHHLEMDVICGVPYTALPIATCLSLTHTIPMVMRRKEIKTYGTKQMIEGVFTQGQRCLIIEDVVTTGGSILETAKPLEEAGLIVNHVMALIDREQGGKTNLNRYSLHTLFSLTEILTTLHQIKSLARNEQVIIEQLQSERS